jgi:hypothetical protein
MDFEDSRFVHYARHNSLGVPMNLPSHPQLRHHVDHLDFMLSETRIDLDNSREYANHTHIQLAQQADTIRVIATTGEMLIASGRLVTGKIMHVTSTNTSDRLV